TDGEVPPGAHERGEQGRGVVPPSRQACGVAQRQQTSRAESEERLFRGDGSCHGYPPNLFCSAHGRPRRTRAGCVRTARSLVRVGLTIVVGSLTSTEGARRRLPYLTLAGRRWAGLDVSATDEAARPWVTRLYSKKP